MFQFHKVLDSILPSLGTGACTDHHSYEGYSVAQSSVETPVQPSCVMTVDICSLWVASAIKAEVWGLRGIRGDESGEPDEHRGTVVIRRVGIYHVEDPLTQTHTQETQVS